MKPIQSLFLRICVFAFLGSPVVLQAQDLRIKKSVSAGGYVVSTTETSIKGARERSVTQNPNGSSVTLHQCDLRRTVTLDEQNQTYFVAEDPQDENAARAAALAMGTVIPDSKSGGTVTVTTSITDTGERKTLYGYQARHLKAKVVQEPSADACTQMRQSFDIDGWFADISKEQSACAVIAPPVRQGNGCHDTIVARMSGSGKAGYPLREEITMPQPNGSNVTVAIQVSEISKQQLPAELFDVPAGYRQVKSIAELSGGTQTPVAQPAVAMSPQTIAPPGSGVQMMNPGNQLAMQQVAMAQAQMMMGGGMTKAGPPNAYMTGGVPSGASAPSAPAVLGPKAPGKIRIGVAPPDAQVGQGNNAGADYSTPIRNAEIALMNGPAVEIAALDSHIPIQLQAEAQQKQCDYIMLSAVAVKHASGGFGRFAKMGTVAASMTPMGMMAHGMGAAAAAQTAAGVAASQMAQQQAMNQLAGFNGQIKSKDDLTVQYQLVPTGQTNAYVQNSLESKAKSDGEDVLTPLLQQAATTVLTAVSKK